MSPAQPARPKTRFPADAFEEISQEFRGTAFFAVTVSRVYLCVRILIPYISGSNASGELIAEVLRTAWRPVPDSLSISAERVSQITPLLLATGAAALAWRRAGALDPDVTSRLIQLKDAYRQHTIEAAVHEINTCDIFKRARAAKIEPLLFKGWALARLYPEDGLRPYGDIDLWVCPEDLESLYRALPSNKDHVYCVEPHLSFYPQYERSHDEVLSRSRLVPLDGVPVRVPGDEDHLRFICLHFLYHGAWRPLWLCDIALMAESAGPEFDWDCCLRGSRKYADWIGCAIGLAHQLLGADLNGTPVEKRAKTLPHWLTNAVLRQWEKGAGMSFAENLSFSFPRRILRPAAFVRTLREHWRNPIQASVEMNAWFNESPRTMLQLGSALRQVPRFARHFGKEIRGT